MKIVRDLPPPAKPNQFIALDSEWFGLNKPTMHRPTSGKFACLTTCYDSSEVYLVDKSSDIQETLDRLKNGIWLIHNAKFDITHLRRHANIPPRTRLIDTMIMDQILWSGLYEKFGEANLVRRYLSEYLDKSPQKEFAEASELTPRLELYAATDTSKMMEFWPEQKKHITKTDMKIWRQIDQPTMWAVLDFQGFRIDVDKWLELVEVNKAREKEVDEQLDFNPRSPQQTLKALRSAGFKGLPNTGAATLDKWITGKYSNTKAAKLAQLVQSSRKYGKRARTYGQKFVDTHAEEVFPGIWAIFTDYWVLGAETGRMSSSDPNMQNIPKRDTKEYRECFIARPGNLIIILDYSAQEPRITAYLSRDKKLISIFQRGEDVYIGSAHEVFGKSITKDDPLRDDMKAVFLGIDYGMTPKGLALKLGVKEKEAEELLAKFYRTFPGVANFIRRQKKETKCTRTVIGRKGYLNPYSWQIEKNALNNPVQGTAADMMKRALGVMHQEWNFDYPFGVVEVTHDEVGLDVPIEIVPEVSKWATDIMVQVGNEMCPGLNFKADALVGDSWACK